MTDIIEPTPIIFPPVKTCKFPFDVNLLCILTSIPAGSYPCLQILNRAKDKHFTLFRELFCSFLEKMF